MKIPKYFYFRVRVKGNHHGKAEIEVEDASDEDVVEVVRCKDCKHRPAFRDDEDGNRYVEGPRYQETLKNGLTVTLEDTGCPCVNGLDSYFSYVPKDEWFCANGERREADGSD